MKRYNIDGLPGFTMQGRKGATGERGCMTFCNVMNSYDFTKNSSYTIGLAFKNDEPTAIVFPDNNVTPIVGDYVINVLQKVSNLYVITGFYEIDKESLAAQVALVSDEDYNFEIDTELSEEEAFQAALLYAIASQVHKLENLIRNTQGDTCRVYSLTLLNEWLYNQGMSKNDSDFVVNTQSVNIYRTPWRGEYTPRYLTKEITYVSSPNTPFAHIGGANVVLDTKVDPELVGDNLYVNNTSTLANYYTDIFNFNVDHLYGYVQDDESKANPWLSTIIAKETYNTSYLSDYNTIISMGSGSYDVNPVPETIDKNALTRENIFKKLNSDEEHDLYDALISSCNDDALFVNYSKDYTQQDPEHYISFIKLSLKNSLAVEEDKEEDKEGNYDNGMMPESPTPETPEESEENKEPENLFDKTKYVVNTKKVNINSDGTFVNLLGGATIKQGLNFYHDTMPAQKVNVKVFLGKNRFNYNDVKGYHDRNNSKTYTYNCVHLKKTNAANAKNYYLDEYSVTVTDYEKLVVDDFSKSDSFFISKNNMEICVNGIEPPVYQFIRNVKDPDLKYIPSFLSSAFAITNEYEKQDNQVNIGLANNAVLDYFKNVLTLTSTVEEEKHPLTLVNLYLVIDIVQIPTGSTRLTTEYTIETPNGNVYQNIPRYRFDSSTMKHFQKYRKVFYMFSDLESIKDTIGKEYFSQIANEYYYNILNNPTEEEKKAGVEDNIKCMMKRNAGGFTFDASNNMISYNEIIPQEYGIVLKLCCLYSRHGVYYDGYADTHIEVDGSTGAVISYPLTPDGDFSETDTIERTEVAIDELEELYSSEYVYRLSDLTSLSIKGQRSYIPFDLLCENFASKTNTKKFIVGTNELPTFEDEETEELIAEIAEQKDINTYFEEDLILAAGTDEEPDPKPTTNDKITKIEYNNITQVIEINGIETDENGEIVIPIISTMPSIDVSYNKDGRNLYSNRKVYKGGQETNVFAFIEVSYYDSRSISSQSYYLNYPFFRGRQLVNKMFYEKNMLTCKLLPRDFYLNNDNITTIDGVTFTEVNSPIKGIQYVDSPNYFWNEYTTPYDKISPDNSYAEKNGDIPLGGMFKSLSNEILFFDSNTPSPIERSKRLLSYNLVTKKFDKEDITGDVTSVYDELFTEYEKDIDDVKELIDRHNMFAYEPIEYALTQFIIQSTMSAEDSKSVKIEVELFNNDPNNVMSVSTCMSDKWRTRDYSNERYEIDDEEVSRKPVMEVMYDNYMKEAHIGPSVITENKSAIKPNGYNSLVTNAAKYVTSNNASYKNKLLEYIENNKEENPLKYSYLSKTDFDKFSTFMYSRLGWSKNFHNRMHFDDEIIFPCTIVIKDYSDTFSNGQLVSSIMLPVEIIGQCQMKVYAYIKSSSLSATKILLGETSLQETY